jgi:hypothetical protein
LAWLLRSRACGFKGQGQILNHGVCELLNFGKYQFSRYNPISSHGEELPYPYMQDPKGFPLDAHEFIRRFLLHALRNGFMRILHFGFLANRAKKHALPQCRKLLGLNPALLEIPDRSTQDLLLELTGVDLSRCPACKKGAMVIVAELPKLCSWDSS